MKTERIHIRLLKNRVLLDPLPRTEISNGIIIPDLPATEDKMQWVVTGLPAKIVNRKGVELPLELELGDHVLFNRRASLASVELENKQVIAPIGDILCKWK